MSETSMMIRRMFGEGDDIRDAGLSTPEGITRYDNIVYGSDSTWQKLDVYRPSHLTQDLPVIVSVHGGAWVYGDKERYQYYCMDLAKRGYAVVNYTYRLAPEHKFPAALEDTTSVFNWVLDHAGEYGFDRSHIFAVGDSAGGSYLSLYLDLCTNPDYAGRFSFKPAPGFVPSAAAFNCSVFRVEREPDSLNSKLMEEFLPGKGTPEELDLIDATRFVTENYPPVFLMTSDGDFLQNQQPHMIKPLMENRIPFEFHFYKGQQEKLPHVFHLNIRSEDAKICNDAQCSFFSRYIKD